MDFYRLNIDNNNYIEILTKVLGGMYRFLCTLLLIYKLYNYNLDINIGKFIVKY